MSRRIVIGDIHGCLKTFKRLVEDIIQLDPEDFLYLIGDFIDRGPDSRGVLDYLMQLDRSGFNLAAVRGNHEDMMLQSPSDNKYLLNWLYNGAETTLYSFGLSPGSIINQETLDIIPDRYYEYIKQLNYYIELEDYLIVHAGFNFSIDNPFEDYRAMIWSREMMYNAQKAGNRKVIHGHTPIALEDVERMVKDPGSNLINIDAGCVYVDYPELGHLAGLDLDTLEIFCQENIDF